MKLLLIALALAAQALLAGAAQAEQPSSSSAFARAAAAGGDFAARLAVVAKDPVQIKIAARHSHAVREMKKATAHAHRHRGCATGFGLKTSDLTANEKAFYSTVLQRFGADSAQARAFIPAADLPSARIRAAAAAVAPGGTVSAAAARDAGGADAGADPVDPALLAQLTEKVVQLESANATGAGARRRLLQSGGLISIKVYIHAVQSSSGAGRVADAVLTAQMKALNDAYNGLGITFQLVQINRITSDDYFDFDVTSSSGWSTGERLIARGCCLS
jgi:hypothetical protein